MERKCGDCALKALKAGVCPVFERDMEGENGCPLFTTEVKTCDICGNVIVSKLCYEIDNDEVHTICRNCLTAHPCQCCVNSDKCTFNSDESCTVPPYILDQRREGRSVTIIQKINPKRVQATCAQGCKCFNAEGLDDGNFCIKTIGCGCINYRANWRN